MKQENELIKSESRMEKAHTLNLQENELIKSESRLDGLKQEKKSLE